MLGEETRELLGEGFLGEELLWQEPVPHGLPVVGSWDEASPEEQMKAINLALRHYFGTEEWLKARDKLYPGLRRRS